MTHTITDTSGTVIGFTVPDYHVEPSDEAIEWLFEVGEELGIELNGEPQGIYVDGELVAGIGDYIKLNEGEGRIETTMYPTGIPA